MLQIIYALAIILFSTSFSHSKNIEWYFDEEIKEEAIQIGLNKIVLPEDYKQAIIFYNNAEYRKCANILEKIINLNLPDSCNDFVFFVLAECYKQLGLKELAKSFYINIIKNFPNSDKVEPALFRLIQYAVKENDSVTIDSLSSLFMLRYKNSIFISPILFINGKLRYFQERYEDAIAVLSQISNKSSYFDKAQFIKSLCYIKKKELEKSIIILNYLIKRTRDPQVVNECYCLLGDIYFLKSQYQTSLKFYKKVSKKSKKYNYAIVKIARVYIETKDYKKAKILAKSFISKNEANEYFFEMVSILEQAYSLLKEEKEEERVKDFIYQQIKIARIVFFAFDEINKINNMTKVWQSIMNNATTQKDTSLYKTAKKNINELNLLLKKYNEMLSKFSPYIQSKPENIYSFYELRYLEMLKDKSTIISDSITILGKVKDSILKIFLDSKDSLLNLKILSLQSAIDSLTIKKNKLIREQQVVLSECFGTSEEKISSDENLQIKFVDWAFDRYQKKKTELTELIKEINAKKKAKTDKDTLSNKEINEFILTNDKKAKKLKEQIAEDRQLLINHLLSMRNIYPKSKYMAQLLFRLAELYFDLASDEFDLKLQEYEAKMASGKDTARLVFPEFNLKKVIQVYDDIVTYFPNDPIAPASLFYKALSLQKMNEYDKANKVLEELTEKYPESEYFVEANMNIARYYFEHPKINNNQGYKLAQEAYHRVLYYRDHPQFVFALYGLGWCYYMQDQYEEAIAVFKYLVEEVALDFDVTKIDEKKQVSNPLLRDEAIDYIAISFDEEGRINDAVKFLQLIGNIDYASMVLKRIAELRLEDMDYHAAIRIYRRLLEEYPYSIVAPDACLGIIKTYELLNMPDSAKKERETFFEQYSKGSKWQEFVWKKDSLLIPHVDSVSITMGLYIGDDAYREAEKKNDTLIYSKAAKFYNDLYKKYPNDKRAFEALWNLGVILDTKLGRSLEAYNNFLEFSQIKNADLTRREKAALNAIAIAQKFIPQDTLFEAGKLDSFSLRLIEAGLNYKNLFPNGSSIDEVLLSMASVYFNRKMYSNALEFYDMVIKKGVINENYYEALFYLGQCHLEKENWQLAEKAFEKVYKDVSEPTRKNMAYKLLLQAKYSEAKQMFASNAFANAAEAFLSIDKNYPNSEYGDIVLFKAAESYEKIENWIKACECYYLLKNHYPNSKLVPGAIFNAAIDYEKADKYDKAAETYELLISLYPKSEKAKDALFNLGLAYEKIGKLDKMAEANERYTQLYPSEKDVQAMLLRSAKYYYKAKLYEKSINAFRNFILQYPQNPTIIEAFYMIGKCYLEVKDKDNAILSFSQAEQLNARLKAAGFEHNDYFAAEAAFCLAELKKEEFTAITFVLPEAKLKANQKLKTQLLAEATKAYEKVIQYQSERLFEAAYKIGQMYEEFVNTWLDQERPKLPPVKLAVLEKDIFQTAAALLQKSIVPYKKVIEIGQGFDSLGKEQKEWIYKAKVSLAKNMYMTGKYLSDAYLAMQNAPIPDEIKGKPLYYYQYLKQVLEAVEPLKIQVMNYFLTSKKQLDSLGLSGQNTAKCLDGFYQLCFVIGNEYELLAEKILKEPEIPKDMSQEEKDELSFQLEDIVYELQDKAIALYEQNLSLLKKENLAQGEWYQKIMLGLARLAPDKYGKVVFTKMAISTSGKWLSRQDSVAGWRLNEIPQNGWQNTIEINGLTRTIKDNSVAYIWSLDTTAINNYFWLNFFIPGQPRDAAIYISVCGKYWLYLNGVLTSSDTLGERSLDKIDSITGIQSLVKGGDNDISIHVISNPNSPKGLGVYLAMLVDTNQHFKSQEKYKKLFEASENIKIAQVVPKDSSIQLSSSNFAHNLTIDTKEKIPTAHKDSTIGKISNISSQKESYKSIKELNKKLEEYNKKIVLLNQEIKKERIEIQKIRIKNEDIDEQIKKVKQEKEQFLKILEEMNRKK
jgi:tetratricopeptide (TPR) repeat protein